MNQIEINNGTQETIAKNTLSSNFHCNCLTKPEFNEFYSLTVNNNPFTRIETDDMPRIPYKDTDDLYYKRSTRHIGQRKLLMSEIEFITKMYEKYSLLGVNKVVLIYVGAAPGYHIPYLVKLFPNLYFHLFDPLNFTINDQTHIKIFQEFFTNDHIAKYNEKAKKKPVLFVSDIRDPYYDNTKTNQLQNDMKMQQDWVIGIKPLGAMFKFRLTFEPEMTTYLNGDSYLPVWGPLTTTETRLICDKDLTNNWTKFKQYDNRAHEQRMMYFNNVYRMSVYQHNVKNVRGICHCFDCTSEVSILINYHKLIGTELITNNMIGNMMNDISELIQKDLKAPNANKESRKKHMQQRKKRSGL